VAALHYRGEYSVWLWIRRTKDCRFRPVVHTASDSLDRALFDEPRKCGSDWHCVQITEIRKRPESVNACGCDAMLHGLGY
jgi:hypothetical protein